MTEQLLHFAQGPLFRLTFVIMVAGLARRLLLMIWSSASVLARAHNREVMLKSTVANLVEWLFPFSHVRKSRTAFTVISYVFHMGVILVPILLAEHIALWRQGIHLDWPALPSLAADVLTLTTIAAGVCLIITRAAYRPSRLFSSTGDYLITALVILPFVTGYTAPRAWNPLSYELTMLIHTIGGEIIFVLIPFSKLAHCFLFPFTRFATGVGGKYSIDVPKAYPH